MPGINASMLILAYLEAGFFTLVNTLYGMFIDRTSLSETFKSTGSRLTLAGAILYPFCSLLEGFYMPMDTIGYIGAAMLMVGIALLAYGLIRQA
ncbi:MAG: hypothetical protein SFZ03_07055 [Candidatus Melainabacteria bacterium]|nr:hypothetical protein [Candidatus Melainabacteria bacterium]